MMNADTATVAPTWVRVAPVRRGMTLKVYGARAERTEAAVHVVCGPVRRDPNLPELCACAYCQSENRSHLRWQALNGGSPLWALGGALMAIVGWAGRSSRPLPVGATDVEVSGMSDEDDVQDWDALLLGRVRRFLDPALIDLGDVVPDGGLLKVVKESSLQNDDTEVLVTFVDGTPGDPHVVYAAGRDTLVWRLPDAD